MVALNLAPSFRDPAEDQKPVADYERQLADWFGRPVVLTSSGRAALLLCLQELGMSRYQSRLAMSPRTAQCVFDAVTRVAFPVDMSSDRGSFDATLLIHQYGHVLRDQPDGEVIEDICHAFFVGPESGARDWAGKLAVFSLTKFFGLGGMAGGIIAADEKLATALRQRRDGAPRLSSAQLARDQRNWRRKSRPKLEEIYLRALLHPQPSSAALSGIPDDLAASGRRRKEVTDSVLAAIPEYCLDNEWRAMCGTTLPFAVPLFAPVEHLNDLVVRLRRVPVEVDIFRIDAARSMTRPELKPAVLLPCHQYISTEELLRLTEVIRSWSATVPTHSGDAK